MNGTLEDQVVDEETKRRIAAVLEEKGAANGDELAHRIVVEMFRHGWRPPGPLSDPTKNALGGFARESKTSLDAARLAYPRSGILRGKVLRMIALRHSADGATSEELTALLNENPYSVKPRLTELRQGGWVEKHGTRTGKSGAQIDVYVLTERAREEMIRHGDVTRRELAPPEQRGW